jgi:nucleoid-associated protein YgaU
MAPVVLFGAASVATARGPGGGYQEPYNGKASGGSGLAPVWSAARAPLRWLRQSSRSFQSLMRLLAERSAGADPPPPPRRPQKEPAEEVEEPPRRSDYGAEAGAGRDRGSVGVRVKEWRKWAPSCRRAGVPVRRGGWYVVQRGDTLWHIAELHYGYGEAYPRIRRANRESVPDADLIYPCQRLYIPRWRCCGPRPVKDIGDVPDEGPRPYGYARD